MMVVHHSDFFVQIDTKLFSNSLQFNSLQFIKNTNPYMPR
jgi:hypothetical protein